MKILILDDDKFRHNVFRRSYAGHEVTHALTYDAFLPELAQRWDLIHLDHDLGDEADGYVDGWGCKQDHNGAHAAMRVAELPDDLRPALVLVQSVNPTGAKAIVDILTHAGIKVRWEPFGDVLP